MEGPEGLPHAAAAPLSPRRQPPPPPLRAGFLRGEAEAEESEEAAGLSSSSSSSGSEEAPPECCEATAHLPYPPTPPSPSRHPGQQQPSAARHHAPPRRSRRRRPPRPPPLVLPDSAGSPDDPADDEDDEPAPPRQGSEDSGFSVSPSDVAPEPRRLRSVRGTSRLTASRCFSVVRELGPEEVRWFYREDRKTWKPFIGYDSLRIEHAFRAHRGRRASSPVRSIPAPDPVCVRGGLYEVDVASKDCYPVYWNQTEKIPVMRGQWFIDGTWQPLEEEESNLIEQEHLSCFKGQQMQETFDMELARPVDGRDVMNSLKLSRTHVDWHSVDEVYLYSDATTSKIARTVTQKLGFSKASSSGTRLHRGYVEEATLEDKPSPTTHIAFVIHGIGQKMDQGRIIRNAATLRDIARKIEEKHFSSFATHVEFLPVEWRSKLALDGDTVDSITPDKIRGLRDILNSSAMDIMYYTSPLYRDELVKGLQQEMNRLYTLFCSRNPDFVLKDGKVSIVSHSLGCVITYDIMTGWNPVRLYEQLVEKEYEDLEASWMTYEEQHLVEEFYLTKQRLRKLEERLRRLKTSTMAEPPALQFKVENFFCMGSPLAVFLALRGIRPGSNGSQDHILSKNLCTRLLNIFHPTDPVAYRLEPLILKHYSNISPVQIHWYNTLNPLPYEQVKLSFLNPSKEPTSTSASESDSVPSLPSPTTSPDVARRHYKESITNIGKASIMGAASLGKGLGGMLFSRFGRANVPVSQALEGVKESSEGDEVPVSVGTQTSQTAQNTQQSGGGSGHLDPILELDRRIDFELREGLVESRYWSAVTSHTAYWSSMDIALFLLTFMYKQDQEEDGKESHPGRV